jgi:glycine/serine hydroxymethyltransferase
MGVAEMRAIGALIVRVIERLGAGETDLNLTAVREEVRELCRRFPLPYQPIPA